MFGSAVCRFRFCAMVCQQALRAALTAAATAAPWLPRSLAQMLHGHGGVLSSGRGGGVNCDGDGSHSSVGCCGGGSRSSSRQACSLAADAEQAFASAPGLQLLLAKSHAMSGTPLPPKTMSLCLSRELPLPQLLLGAARASRGAALCVRGLTYASSGKAL
jgi:hypothetical protein